MLIKISTFISSGFFSILVFWDKIDYLKFGRSTHCYILITILIFGFSIFFHSGVMVNLLPISDALKIDWKLAQGTHYVDHTNLKSLTQSLLERNIKFSF